MGKMKMGMGTLEHLVFREACNFNSLGTKEGPLKRCHQSRGSKVVKEQAMRLSGGWVFPQKKQQVPRS